MSALAEWYETDPGGFWDELAPPRDTGPDLAGLLAQLNVTIGALTEQHTLEARRRADLLERLATEVYFLEIPATQGVVASDGTLTILSAEQLGPKLGNVWDVRRVSVTGLASSSETVTLWRVGAAVKASAQPQNFIKTMTGPSDYLNAGLGAIPVRPNQSLMVTGTGLTVGEPVTVSGDGICVPRSLAGLYLL